MTNKIPINIKVRGGAAPSGGKHIGFKQRSTEVFIPLHLATSADIEQVLCTQGIIVGGRAAAAQLRENVAEVKSFAPVEILTHTGWNGAVFARSDGKVLTPKSVAEVATSGIGFRRHPTRQRRAGKQSEYKRCIMPTLFSDAGGTLLLCGVLAPTVRTLLSQPIAPFGLELLNDRGTAKLRRIAESLIGSMSASFLGGDPVQALLNEPDVIKAADQDSPMLIGDVETFLYGASDKSRKASVRRLLFDDVIPDGGDLNIGGKPAPMALMIQRRPIATALDLDREAANRLARGMLTIDLSASVGNDIEFEARHSVEGARPWSEVDSDLGHNYGGTLFTFQRRLVERRAKMTLLGLQAKLDGYFAKFCKRVSKAYPGAQLPDHVVQRFALLYTAFRAARLLRVIPKIDQTCPPLWRSFEVFVASLPKLPTAAGVLAEIAALPGVLYVNDLDRSRGQAELSNAPAFIKVRKDGRRELCVWSERKDAVFNWPIFSQLPDFAAHFIKQRDKGHLGGKLVIGGWKGQRFLRFRLL